MREIQRLEMEITNDILPGIISALAERDQGRLMDREELLHRAVMILIHWILAENGYDSGLETPKLRALDNVRAGIAELRAPMDELPFLYERLREYEPGEAKGSLRAGKKRARRNQGLFYTPAEIVDHIVRRSFGEYCRHPPGDKGHIKVLDPAMGAGLFLKRALEELWDHNSPDVRDRARILRENIYGVDLDPIACAIASVLPAHEAGVGDGGSVREITGNIRQGNALVGSIFANTADREAEDRLHAKVYLKRAPSQEQLKIWRSEVLPFHWSLEFPDVFERRNPGFDIIIGNPPYEILSVKESGMARRKMEQDYFRRFYRGCSGKINLYRLMLERALNLLRDGGVLGFILPGTLLGDSGAKRIREELFESGKVLEALIIPEKARIFRGVTQALLILIVRKGAGTNHIRPSYLAGKKWGQFSPAATISRNLIELCGHRVPLLESEEEKRLLERISKFPPMRGDQEYEPIGRARQGEINMTANRAHITEHPTNYPLIRGEHVKRFLVCHPSSRPGRFDWVKEDYARLIIEKVGDDKPWLTERVVLARAVNMASRVRLKAARIKPYQFQGDMTNCLYGLRIDMDFLLGLLNSDLLNWRFRKTSANNYVSMAEVMALPVPRPAPPWVEPDTGAQVKALIGDLHRVPSLTMDGYKELVSPLSCGADGGRSALIEIIREASIFLRDRMKDEGAGKIQRLLNLSVCDYYGVVEFADMLEK